MGIKFNENFPYIFNELIFHFISAESENYQADYKIINKELEDYNSQLTEKQEYIFITKSDLVAPEILKERLKKFKKKSIPISIYDYDSIEKVKKILNEISKEK